MVVHDVKYTTFLLVLHYLYTDEVQIQIDNAMDLFQVRAILCAVTYSNCFFFCVFESDKL